MAFLTKIGQVLKTDISKESLFGKKEEEAVQYSLINDLKKRRSVYELGRKVYFSQNYLTQLIKEAVRCCPSALNSQSVRVVILMEDTHYQFWQNVKTVQKQYVPEHVFEGAVVKIDRCADAFGTVLFFEDQQVIQSLQKQRPLQADEFPLWSEQTSGMAQFAVWAALSSAGLGAALHHYNPAINPMVTEQFNLPQSWVLKAQLAFGSINQAASEKIIEDDTVLFRVFA